MGQKFANNAEATLASGIAAGDTTITLTTGQGAKFPSAGGTSYFYGTLSVLVGAVETVEIVKVTTRSGDILTVVRGQDGTTALAWAAGVKFGQRVNAAVLNDIIKGDGGTVSGTGAVTLGGGSAIGNNSIAMGGGTAWGANSVAIRAAASGGSGVANNANSVAIAGITSADGAIAVGGTASGANTIAVGGSATAYDAANISGSASGNVASGNHAVTIGGMGNTASAEQSAATGSYGNAYLQGQRARGFGTAGRQASSLPLLKTTSTNSPAVMLLLPAGYQSIVPASTAWLLEGRVLARQATTGDCKAWKFEGIVKRDAANNTVLVAAITPTVIAADAGASAWAVTVVANNTTEELEVTVTGETGKTIAWICDLRLVELV